MGDKPARIGFEVQAEGVHYYLTDLRLEPRETRAIDLRKLRDRQEEDFQGARIPAAASDGSVLWGRIDNVPVMGRLVVLRRGKRLASNYDCAMCQCPEGLTSAPLIMNPSSATIKVGSSKQISAKATYINCIGAVFYYDVTNSSMWSSGNTAVPTVAKGNVTGKRLGTAIITDIAQDCGRWDYSYLYDDCECAYWRSARGSANVTVNYGCNYQRDTIIQEYHDYSVSYKPVCTNFTKTAHSAYYAFSQLNTGDYSWALVKRRLVLAASTGYGLDKRRVEYANS